MLLLLWGLKLKQWFLSSTSYQRQNFPKRSLIFLMDQQQIMENSSLCWKRIIIFVKSSYPEVLKTLLEDVVITRSRIQSSEVSDIRGGDMLTVSKTLNEIGGSHTELIGSEDITAVIGEKETHSFEIDHVQVENVK